MHILKNNANAHIMTKYCNATKIVNAKILSGKYQKKPPKRFDEFLSLLPLNVVGFGHHGNNIFILLQEYMIWSTLGLAGFWNNQKTEYSRIEFELSDGNKVYFDDQRNFGTISFYNGKYQMLKKLNSLEFDIFAKPIEEDEFKAKLTKYSDCSVAYLFQKKYTGLELSWIEEILHQCEIDPNKKCSDLKTFEINVIIELTNDLIQEIKSVYDPFEAIDLSFEKEFIGNLDEDDEGREVKTITTFDNVKIKSVY